VQLPVATVHTGKLTSAALCGLATTGQERCFSAPRQASAHQSKISDQQFQAGQFPAGCRAPQSTCKKDSLPLQRLESTAMPESDQLRLSAPIVDLEQWCIPG